MSFLKDTFFYSGSTIGTQLITFARGVGVRRLLVPEILGSYSLIQVIVGLMAVIDFGATSAASRELPILRGKKAFDKEVLVRSTVLWFTIFQSVIVGSFTLIYALYNKANYSDLELNGFYIVAILIFLSSFSSCYIVYFQSAQLYRSLSKIILLMSVLETVSYLIGAYYFKITGLLFAVVGMSLIRTVIFIITWNKKEVSINREFSLKVLKNMLHFGFPLRIIDYPNRYMVMADVLWVTRFMDIASLALYSTARLFFLQAGQISTSMGTVFATRIIQLYGKDGSFSQIQSYIKRYLYFQLLVVVPLVICISSIVIPLFLRQIMPKYLPCNDTVIVLLMGNFFMVVNSGLTIPWFIKKQLVPRGISNIVGLFFVVISLVLSWYVFNRHDITGVAISVTAGYFLYFVYMLIAVGKEMWSTKDVFKVLLFVILSFLYTGIVIFASNNFILIDLTFLNDIIQTLKIGGLTLLSISPLLLIGLKMSDYTNFLKATKR